jgi:hypothetical protein
VLLTERARSAAVILDIEEDRQGVTVVFRELQFSRALVGVWFEAHLAIQAVRFLEFINHHHAIWRRLFSCCPRELAVDCPLSESDLLVKFEFHGVLFVDAIVVCLEECSLDRDSLDGLTWAVSGALVLLTERARSAAVILDIEEDRQLLILIVGELQFRRALNSEWFEAHLAVQAVRVLEFTIQQNAWWQR